jgi:hypothetical protein
VRLLCGYLKCEALNFAPLCAALPDMVHVCTAKDRRAARLGATLRQIVEEVDRPYAGGLSMLERLTEITFIELLRHQILAADPGKAGWLAALADPALGRCLAHIHEDPAATGRYRIWPVSPACRAARSPSASRRSSARLPSGICASGGSIWPALP